MMKQQAEKDIQMFIYYDFLTRKTFRIGKAYDTPFRLFTLRFTIAICIFFALYFGFDVSKEVSVISSISFFIVYNIYFRMTFLRRMPIVEEKKQPSQNVFVRTFHQISMTCQSSYAQRIKLMVLSILLLLLLLVYIDMHAVTQPVFCAILYGAAILTLGYIAFNALIILIKFYKKLCTKK